MSELRQDAETQDYKRSFRGRDAPAVVRNSCSEPVSGIRSPNPAARLGIESRLMPFRISQHPVAHLLLGEDDRSPASPRNPAARARSAASGRAAFLAARLLRESAGLCVSAPASGARTSFRSSAFLGRRIRHTPAALEPLSSIRRLSRRGVRAGHRIHTLLCTAASGGGEANLRPLPGGLLQGLGIPSTTRYTQRGAAKESKSRVVPSGVFSTSVAPTSFVSTTHHFSTSRSRQPLADHRCTAQREAEAGRCAAQHR